MSRYQPPGNYLPHESPMILLDEVVSVADNSADCRVAIHSAGVLAPFLTAEHTLPGWYGLELMAQTVGVWSGWHRQQRGQQSIALGMVLGAREYICPAGEFPADVILDIHVSLLMQDARFGSFECTISHLNQTLATGRINTFQPDSEELASLFQQGKTP